MITNLKIGYNGKLGNQLFQFCSLVGIAVKKGYTFGLPKNNLKPIQSKTMDGKYFDARLELFDCFDLDENILFENISFSGNLCEKHFHFDESIFNVADNFSIDGYFQSDKYFKHCKDLIFDLLKFKNEIIEKSKMILPKTDKELVSIHVRRGDYTHPNPYHPVLDESYVDNALKEFNSDEYHFVVFSDDTDWCKSIWGNSNNFHIVDSNSHFIDLCAMSLCNHNIIGNSTFSWWASYLNKNPNKKIIAPKKWFGSGYSNYIVDDLYTEDMILVDTEKNANLAEQATINIITICTGKYVIYFEEFYKTCEKYFLPNYKKKYFVFTDGEVADFENIIKIHQKKLGWPYDSMMRFRMFNSVKEKMTGEYSYFFNVNMEFLELIGDEVLPSESNDYLVGVNHPGFYNKFKHEMPYERRFESNFYIGYDNGKIYYQGCFHGGRTKEFFEMSEILETKIDSDVSVGIIPIWHDESALNWWYNQKNPLVLDSGYAYPESWHLNFVKKAIQRDKNKLGGHNFLRS